MSENKPGRPALAPRIEALESKANSLKSDQNYFGAVIEDIEKLMKAQAAHQNELSRRLDDIEQFFLDQHEIGKRKATVTMKARYEEFLEYLRKKKCVMARAR